MITWLIVIGMIVLQFVGANKKRKAAEAKKRAILEEQMRRAAEASEYSYDTSIEEGEDYVDYADYEEFPEEAQPETARATEKYSDDPFDFFNLQKLVKNVNVVMSTNRSYYNAEERLSERSSEADMVYIEEVVPEENYYDSVGESTILGDPVLEGVRATEDEADEIGGANDEAGLYSEEYEARNAPSPIVASFDPKLFVLYSEIARPKYQE